MQPARLTRMLAGTLCATLLAAPVAHADQTIQCASDRGRYRYCNVDTGNRVSLSRQLSSTYCRLGDNWGHDRHGVQVDRGCRAEFRVGHDSGRSNKDAAIAAGAAVAGSVLIAALAARNERSNQEVSSWTIGSFSGYDETERSDVNVTILPGGSVTGYAGGHEFTGSLNGSKLELGRYHFNVERSGNGFTATDQSNSRHRVNFRRTGSGY
jgi:Protein of unknown function (DUF3011)